MHGVTLACTAYTHTLSRHSPLAAGSAERDSEREGEREREVEREPQAERT